MQQLPEGNGRDSPDVAPGSLWQELQRDLKAVLDRINAEHEREVTSLRQALEDATSFEAGASAGTGGSHEATSAQVPSPEPQPPRIVHPPPPSPPPETRQEPNQEPSWPPPEQTSIQRVTLNENLAVPDPPAPPGTVSSSSAEMVCACNQADCNANSPGSGGKSALKTTEKTTENKKQKRAAFQTEDEEVHEPPAKTAVGFKNEAASDSEQGSDSDEVDSLQEIHDEPTGRGKRKRGSAAMKEDSGFHGELSLVIAGEWEEIDLIDDFATSLKSKKQKEAEQANGSVIALPDPGGDQTSLRKSMVERISKMIVIHPSARARIVWDMLGMLFLCYDLILIPLQAFSDYLLAESFWVKDIGLMSSIYWALDMLSSFILGYHTKGFVEMNMCKITRHYLKTWFLLDFGLVSVDAIFIITGLGQNASPLRIGKTFSRLSRVLRLLRIVKMHGIVTNLIERIRSEYVRTFITIIGVMCLIVLANHFIACGWYLLSFVDENKNWKLVTFSLPEHDDFTYRYATSLHWSLTQFTPASMEVHPQNKIERVYAVCVLLLALVAFSSFISSITQAMTHLREMNAQRIEQENLLRRYLNQHGISGKLVNRVWHYLHQKEVVNMGRVRTKAKEVKSLSSLPKSMRVELALESFGPELRKHPFFFHFGFHNPTCFKDICFHAVVEMSLLTRSELFADEKTEPVSMFFVMDGLMEYALPCMCAEVPNKILEEENDVPDSQAAYAYGSLGSRKNNRWEEVFGVKGNRSSTKTEDEEKKKNKSRAANKAKAKSLAMQFETSRKLAQIEAGSADISGSRYADRIKKGQWACEAALWAHKVDICSPFTALVQSEVFIVDSARVRTVFDKYPSSKAKAAKYGQSFLEYMEHMTNCKWRCVICNDYSILEDLTHRVFDYTVVVGKDRVTRKHMTVHGKAPGLDEAPKKRNSMVAAAAGLRQSVRQSFMGMLGRRNPAASQPQQLNAILGNQPDDSRSPGSDEGDSPEGSVRSGSDAENSGSEVGSNKSAKS
eukprot:TRINITY_DN65860_c0_g1_i1.p1 TRINITY_DN65860_c0_g1~~TRINITY_DN65860_c0_g1_i1.p1  ORF type:complete len:1032 (+),score=195.78 TRINITY_DN65860_c0_g1_i1:64-3096(+)